MKNTLRCPRCNKEYTLSEIYLPKSFIGSLNPIARNLKGDILEAVGTEPDLMEEYTCSCGCRFSVKTKVSFDVKDLNKEYSTKRYANLFELSEEGAI